MLESHPGGDARGSAWTVQVACVKNTFASKPTVKLGARKSKARAVATVLDWAAIVPKHPLPKPISHYIVATEQRLLDHP